MASRNIRVNAVAPGYIDTAMTQTLPEERTKHILNMVASKRMGTMEEVAEAVAFLLQAKYITGHVLAVDGGMFVKSFFFWYFYLLLKNRLTLVKEE